MLIKVLIQVYIYKETELLYHRQFGKALKQDIFSRLVGELMREAFSGASVKGVDSYDYYKYRVSYTIDFDSKLMFIFVSSLTDSPDSIKNEILKCKKDFLNLVFVSFENISGRPIASLPIIT